MNQIRRYIPALIVIIVVSLWLFSSVYFTRTVASEPTRQPIVALPMILTAITPTPTSIPTVIPTATATPTVTATPSPTPVPAWRFVIFGDTRTSGFEPPQVLHDLVQLASTAQPEISLAVGDLILSMDRRSDVDTQWQNWLAAMEPLRANTSVSDWLLVTPGNHDVEGASWAIDQMAKAFPDLPNNGPSNLELAYRRDYKNVRFISIVSERYQDKHRIDDQLSWLETQLRNNPQPYTIVFSHDPAFPVGPHIGSSLDAYPKYRDRLWALLKKYKVTAYIAGHEHLYDRSSHDGITQLIIGTSGSYVYPGLTGSFYHYALAEVDGQTIKFRIYDNKGRERDSFGLP